MNNRITVGEIIALVDLVMPNSIDKAQKQKWLSNIEKQIKTDIIDTHEGGEIIHASNTEDDAAQLIVPRQFADVYRFYLEYQIALVNQEIDQYNAAAAMYDNAYQNFEMWYHSRNLPLQENSIHF